MLNFSLFFTPVFLLFLLIVMIFITLFQINVFQRIPNNPISESQEKVSLSFCNWINNISTWRDDLLPNAWNERQMRRESSFHLPKNDEMNKREQQTHFLYTCWRGMQKSFKLRQMSAQRVGLFDRRHVYKDNLNVHYVSVVPIARY